MKTKLVALLATISLWGCGGGGTDASSSAPLSARQTVVAAAASTRPPRQCGPVIDPPTGSALQPAIGVCPADEKCCNGFCVIDTALCVAPPPQCSADNDCPQPGAPCLLCADGSSSSCPQAICRAGQCEVKWTPCPSPKTCNPASASAVNQCPAHEACCNGLCQPQGELCKAPECASAVDCKGPLPQLCEICSNGKTECAHWECAAGACVTAFCDPLPPSPGPAASTN